MGRDWLLNPFKHLACRAEAKVFALVMSLYFIFAVGCSANGKIDELLSSSIGSGAQNTGVKINSGNASTTVLTGTCDTEGALINITGSATASTTCHNGQWTVTVDVSQIPDGPVEFIATLTMGDGSTVSTVLSGTKKTTMPTVAISTLASSVITSNNVSSFNFAGTCSENNKPVVIASGSFSDSTTCVSGSWNKNINVSSLGEGNLSFSVKQTDDVGNTTTVFQTQTKDTLPPANASTTLSGAPSGTSSATVLNVTVNGAVDADRYMFKIGVASSTDCASAAGYGTETLISTHITSNIGSIADGPVKLCVIARDANGNYQSPAQAAVATWTKDADAPSVVISSSYAASTNANPMIFTITFSETVSNFIIADITVGNGTKQNFSGSGTTYTVEVVPTSPGAVTVDVAAGVAQDAGSNNNTAATQYSRTYDNAQPTVTITSSAGTATNASPIPFTVTFNKAVTGFTAGDISSSNGLVQNFTGTGTTYTFDVPPTTDGAVNINIAAGVASDSAGNTNTAATQLTRTYDTGKPTPVITATQTSPTNAATINVTVTFDEAVSNFVIGDITVANGTKGALSGSGTTYTFDITPTANTTVTVDIAAGVADDAATNTNYAATQFSIVHDNQAPTLSGLSDDTTPRKTKTWSWGCSETCTYRYVIDTTSNTTPSTAYGSTTTDSQASGTNTYYIHVQARDQAGNTVLGHYSAVIDNTAPTAGTINDGTYLSSLTDSPSISWSGFSDNIAIHHYEYAIGSASAGFDIKNWTNNSTTTSVTATGLSLSTNTTYYGSVRAFDEAGNSVEVNGNGWMADTTAPSTPGSVDDGTTFSSLSSSPTVTWSASTDTSGSGIASYEMAVGTTQGTANIKGWTNVGTGTSASVTGMTLTAGTTYYASVRAVDNAGNVSSTVGQGDGWTALNPTIPDSYSYGNTLSMHFDGDNGDNGFKPSVSSLVATLAGDVSISGNSKFGGGSASFDGSGDSLSYPDDNAFKFSADFTVEFWVRVNSLTGSGVEIMSKRSDGESSGNAPFTIMASGPSGSSPGNYIWAGLGEGTCWGVGNCSFGAVSVGNWQHIAISRSGSTVRFYVDGVLGLTKTNSNPWGGNTRNLEIGYNHVGAGWMNGQVDEVRFSDNARYTAASFTPPTSAFSSDANTTFLVHFDAMADFSGWQNAVKPIGGALISTTQSKFGGSAAYFDGSNDYLSVPDSAGLELSNQNFTIEFWMRSGALSGYRTVLARYPSSGDISTWIGTAGTGLGVYFSSNGSSWNLIGSDTVATGLSTNTWYHIAIVRDGANLIVFKDGVQTYNSAVFGVNSLFNSTQTWVIGGETANSQYFQGHLDDLRVTKGAARYTANFTPATATFSNYQNLPLTISTTGQYKIRFAAGTVNMKAWGGGGGGGYSGAAGSGGAGGFASASSMVIGENDVLSLTVGGGGAVGTGVSSTTASVGGVGGGGTGGYSNDVANGGAGAGGGRSEISRNGTVLVVAGGGGGGSSAVGWGGGTGFGNGGAGGGSTGASGGMPSGCSGFGSSSVATGGTQSAAGAAGVLQSQISPYDVGVTAGSGSSGGNGAYGVSNGICSNGGPCASSAGGGGGGGYFGGGGGGQHCNPADVSQGGAGGSGYVISGATSPVNTQGSGTTPGNATDIDRVSGVAIGGAVGSSGGNGQISIWSVGFAANSVSPNVVATAGGTTITIAGIGFDATTAVSIGGTTCTVTAYSNLSLNCTTPAKSVASYDVVVSQSGQISVTLTNAISYVTILPMSSTTCSPGSYTGGKCVFNHTGAVQNWTVPAGLTSIQVKMWGAGGGGPSSSKYGGGGGYATGTVAVSGSESLSLIVGRGGEAGRASVSGVNGANAAWCSYNSRADSTIEHCYSIPAANNYTGEIRYGGGAPAHHNSDGGGSGGGGGGAFIKRSSSYLIVAGGGGGGGNYTTSGGGGGAGGGTAGGTGASGVYGPGGSGGDQTQTSNGAATSHGWNGQDGIQMYGGIGASTGGGGGGYYGGGGGSNHSSGGSASGGGGSSYIGGSGVSSASTTAGSGQTPGNSGDGERGTAGNGGSAGADGGDAKIIISW